MGRGRSIKSQLRQMWLSKQTEEHGYRSSWLGQGRGGGGYGICVGQGTGVRPNEGGLSEGGGGAFGGRALFSTAPLSQGLQDGTHSKAHDFKKEWERE